MPPRVSRKRNHWVEEEDEEEEIEQIAPKPVSRGRKNKGTASKITHTEANKSSSMWVIWLLRFELQDWNACQPV